MRMRHFEDQYGHFLFLEKNLFGKMFLLYVYIALLYHKKYEENRYRADIKKS